MRDFTVDYERGQLFWKNVSKYHREKNGREAGNPRMGGGGKRYWIIRWNRQALKRGHLIFFLGHDRWPRPFLDHINGDSLDDRPSNLREATATQNAWNHKKRAKRSTLPMGVRLVPHSGRYQARIAYNKRMLHLGTYDTPEQAQEVYLAKRKELYREFA